MATVLISYSHKDEKWKNIVVNHLRALENMNLIKVWSDRRIKVGSVWEEQIKTAIFSSDIAILLISVDYLSSDYIVKKELPLLLEQHERRNMTIIPLIVGECIWKELPGLSAIQARPLDGKPLSVVKSKNRRDKIITDLVKEIKEITGQKSAAAASSTVTVPNNTSESSASEKKDTIGTPWKYQPFSNEFIPAPSPNDLFSDLKKRNRFWIEFNAFIRMIIDLFANSPVPNGQLHKILTEIFSNGIITRSGKLFWGNNTLDYLAAIDKYNKQLHEGKSLIAGKSGDDKRIGLKSYETACSIADELFKQRQLPRYLTGHLKAQALSHIASALFYERKFNGSINNYDMAQEIYERDEVREGYENNALNDKEIAVKAFKLSAFLPSALSNSRETQYIYDYYLEKFDATTTDILKTAIRKDEGKDNSLCDALLRYIASLTGAENDAVVLNSDYHFDEAIRRADRRTIMQNRAIYLSNRAYTDLHLSKYLNNTLIGKSAADNYLIAINYYIDGALGVAYRNRDYNDNMIAMYFNYKGKIDSATERSIFNSVGRNLCYRYMACHLAEMSEEANLTYSTLMKLAEKEKRNGAAVKESAIMNTLATAERNLREIKMDSVWDKLKMDRLIKDTSAILEGTGKEAPAA